eukprot:m.203949 g.203949  ORF g.203949 m.203949 type:complete len:121 (+) comp15768_c1_seq4:49-411(+)
MAQYLKDHFPEVDSVEKCSVPNSVEIKIVLKVGKTPSTELVQFLRLSHRNVMFAIQSNVKLTDDHGGKKLNDYARVYNINDWFSTKLRDGGLVLCCGLVLIQKWGQDYYVILVKKKKKNK